jgi:hypothetical protein
MAAKQENNELFAESSRGAVSALTFVGFIFAAVLFFGGMVVMSFGFGGATTTQDAIIFIVGIASSFAGVGIAFGVIPAIESSSR